MRLRTLVRWQVWSAIIWMAFGAFNGTQEVVGMRAQGMHHAWVRMFFVFALSWLPWALLTPAVLVIGNRFPIQRHWLIHLSSYLAITLVDAAWTMLLNVRFHPMGALYEAESHRLGIVHSGFFFFYSRFHLDLLAYAGVLAVGRMQESRTQLAQRDQQLAQAKLQALRHQLQPHFLFNALNGIAGLIRLHKNDAAVEMLAGLSDLLRRFVRGPDEPTNPLSEEFAFIEQYLAIQQMRFGGKMTVEIDLPASLASVSVPSMIFQPLVENAIEHGLTKSMEGGLIKLTARSDGQVLKLSVQNDGPAVHKITEGIGISNTRARLKNLFGSHGAFELRNTSENTVIATVTVPIR
jgi:two-component system LytT family sensor kinase